MKRRLRVVALTLSMLSLNAVAQAQVPPPPGPAEPLPPPPPPAPPMGSPATDPLAGSNPDIEPEQTASPPPPPPAADGSGSTQQTAQPDQGAAAAGKQDEQQQAAKQAELAEIEKHNKQRQARLESLKLQPSLRGSTGLLRTHYAGSGAPGTFRFALLSSYFGQREFLCPQCTDSQGGPGYEKDKVSRVGAHLRLSVTPWEFLEGYLGVHSTATSNSRGEPQLLQVLGDTTWGVKGFMPRREDQVFTAGGAAELQLLNGAGSVGVDNASYALRGLATLDLTNRSDPNERLPLRVNFNLSYIFDNSGKLVEGIEADRQQRISRIERYGLNINRVDRLVPAIGIEAPLDYIHPFIEWSIDIPSNRQDYRCVRNDRHASDVCMTDFITFGAVPSRLTIGANGYVLLEGLALNAALDIGTGGTNAPFWEETQPETPWNLYFGAAYAVDTQPQVEIRKVEIPVETAPVETAKPQIFVQGVVVEEGAPETVVPDALIHYEGRPLTGMIADSAGRFRTAALEPGSYTFSITAEHYEPGTCNINVSADAAAEATSTAGASTGEASSAEASTGAPPVADPTQPPGAAPAQPPAAAGEEPAADKVLQLRCELKAEPRVGTIDGYVTNGLTNDPLAMADITVTDAVGRKLTMKTDDQGMFVVTNVPPGAIKVSANAEGHFRASVVVEVVPYKTVQAQLPVFSEPKRANFTKAGTTIRVRSPIEFRPGTAEFEPKSLPLLDELSAFLRDNEDLKVEIQSHTGGTGSAEVNLELSAERANAIKDALVNNGVAASRLTAKGYGDTKPKGKNSERVELKVLP